MELPVDYNKLTQYERKLVREEYIRRQKNKCMWCSQPLSGPPSKDVDGAFINMKLFPPNFFGSPVHLQHCHKSGLTEGAVHARCNAYMWQYENR